MQDEVFIIKTKPDTGSSVKVHHDTQRPVVYQSAAGHPLPLMDGHHRNIAVLICTKSSNSWFFFAGIAPPRSRLVFISVDDCRPPRGVGEHGAATRFLSSITSNKDRQY